MKALMSPVVLGILAIVVGILIIVFPHLVAWIVGIFLIIWGVLTLLGKKL